MEQNHLIIFVKNPERGKVKTRLAASIGDDLALKVYQVLLDKTREITAPLDVGKHVYYSGSIDKGDAWARNYEQNLQTGTDLGDKMRHAFEDLFRLKAEKVCIVGSDCYELSTDVIEKAFQILDDDDVVIGPANDGGYYLLGMRQFHPKLFDGVKWSTAKVLAQTTERAVQLGLTYHLLPTLIDIDLLEDLEQFETLRQCVQSQS